MVLHICVIANLLCFCVYLFLHWYLMKNTKYFMQLSSLFAEFWPFKYLYHNILEYIGIYSALARIVKKYLVPKELNGRWFPQIVDHVDRDSGNLYPIHITKIVVLASEPVGGRSRATELPCYSYVYRVLWCWHIHCAPFQSSQLPVTFVCPALVNLPLYCSRLLFVP